MEKIIILSNLGSASKKYSIYRNSNECAWFHIEKKDSEYVCSSKINNDFQKKHITQKIYATAFEYVVQNMIDSKIISSLDDIMCVSVRSVIPHPDFVQDMLCTDDVYDTLKKLKDLDPLHMTPLVEEVELIHKTCSDTVAIYLISDSTFHSTYKVPAPLPFKKTMYTIGYHGLACESVIKILDREGIKYSKLIITHLGGGSSVTGVVSKKSVFNSMQFSPLGGMIMSSRSGSIDPFLIMSYMKEYKLSYEDMLDHLYNKSGLFAISGTSADLRVLREHALSGNIQAKNTIMFFVDSIVSTIAQALTYTQGADTLVFSGTIGIRASYIRELVIEKLMWLGFVLNHAQNNQGGSECFEISAYDSRIKIYVVHIDEMKEMYTHTQFFLEKNKK